MAELISPKKLRTDITDPKEGLNYIINFLQSKTWYLSTIDEYGFPYSRPMSLVILHEGHLYFATSKQKDMVKHIASHSEVGIYAAIHGSGKMRLTAHAYPCYSDELAAMFYEVMPRHYLRYVGEDKSQAQFYRLDELKAEYMANYVSYAITLK